MPQLWVYEVELDSAGRELTLESEGPSFDDSGGSSPFRDVIEIINNDQRRQKSMFKARTVNCRRS